MQENSAVHAKKRKLSEGKMKENDLAPRDRIENKFIARYDPQARDMSLLNLDKSPYRGPVQQSDIQYPLRVVLEIDSRCNMRCQYCSEGANPPKFSIPKEKLFALIDQVEEMQVPELTIRGGEATVHPDFFEIWDYAQSKNFTSTNLITNGYVLNPRKVEHMLQNPRAKLIASLDGFPQVNALYRDPKQFEQVLSWLLPAIEKTPNQVVLLSVVYRQNYESIPTFAQSFAQKDLQFYHLSPLKRLGRSEIVATNFVSYDEINQLQTKLDALQSTYKNFRPTVSCIALEKYKTNKTQNIPMPFFTELHFGTGVKVTPNGQIMVNRGIMFTKHFKDQLNITGKNQAEKNLAAQSPNNFVEEKCLEPLGSIYDESRDFKTIWVKSLEQRLLQAKIADNHYDYYLGWLKSLKTQ